jgi:hypothetical protein
MWETQHMVLPAHRFVCGRTSTVEDKTLTPWQKVHAKFGISSSKLADEIGRHRSKISRALQDDQGLINGKDQVLLLAAAKRLNVELEPSDLMNV